MRHTGRFRLFDAQIGIGLRDLLLGFVFALGGLGLRTRDAHCHLLVGNGLAYFRIALGLRHLDLGVGDCLRGGFLAQCLDIADSSVTSWMFTLIRRRPTFSSSVLTLLVIASINRSRSALIFLDPHGGDHLPHLAEDDLLASCMICALFKPSKRSAALPIFSGSGRDAYGKRGSTLTRIFCLERALFSWISIDIGRKSKTDNPG